nr:transposase [Streptomyces sp. AgN23]
MDSDLGRRSPGADVAAVTTAQIREVIERLVASGQWTDGDPDVLVVVDAGYDAPRLTHLLADLPVEILGRTRSDRVMRRPTPPRVYDPKGGRPPKHGGEFVFGQPSTWGAEHVVTVTDTRLYGKATAQAWDRLHPRLTRRAAWIEHSAELPIIEGTVIQLEVSHLPSGTKPKPVWLWWSKTGATAADVDRCWQAFLRRFDVEHLPDDEADTGLDCPQAPQPRGC